MKKLTNDELQSGKVINPLPELPSLTKAKEKLNFAPHPNNIIIYAMQKEKTEGGIILPEGASDTTPTAVVLAIGDNYKGKMMFDGKPLEVGDECYINVQFIQVFPINKIPYGIIFPDAIIGKVNK
jgi:co-chaperonin GroES (HSP10)